MRSLQPEPPPGTLSRADYHLARRYEPDPGLIHLTGIQALVRMLLDRQRHDRMIGHCGATYVCGYEGSPLAGYDLELARQAGLLGQRDIVYQPGLNEELAATAVSGTQLAAGVGRARFGGVTGVWYGKAPGLDRAADPLRHANLVGTSGDGGAIAVVGDDPAAKSSSVPSSSAYALADLAIPALVPADPAEILTFGLHGLKTRIDQDSCNLDYSCLAGDCPSFLTVTVPPRAETAAATQRPVGAAAALPEPDASRGDSATFSVRITGVGGTGVVTVAQILAVAALIDGKHTRGLDQTGLAQKGGAVVSDLTITSHDQPGAASSPRAAPTCTSAAMPWSPPTPSTCGSLALTAPSAWSPRPRCQPATWSPT
jgi:Pyruvate ferredoxin/flavodoxin oxidoreductase